MGNDILSRLNKHRSPFAEPESALSRSRRWLWPLAGLWLLYVGVLSDHSLWRLWQVGHAASTTAVAVQRTQAEAVRVDRQLHDPDERRDLAEQVLREEHGLARPGEQVYRVEGEPAADSSRTR